MWVENRRKEDVKIVFYKDFEHDLVKTTKEVLEFIGVEIDLARLQCLKKNQNRTFKREQKNSETNFKKYFSVSQKFLIAKHVKMLNATLVQNDQKNLPTSYLDFSKFGHI